MSKAETVVSCPFCRRVYKMLLDREAAERTRARASCGRCGNSFELAARVATSNPARAMPPPPEPPSPALTKMRRAQAVDPRSADADDLALDDLVRDIAHAAEQIVDAEEKTAPPVITSAKPLSSIAAAAAPAAATRERRAGGEGAAHAGRGADCRA